MSEPKVEKPSFKNIIIAKPFEKFGDSSVSASIIGIDERLPEAFGWSLRGMRTLEHFENPGRSFLKRFFLDYSKYTGIKHFYAPIAHPQNGIVSTKHEHPYELDFGNGIVLRRGQNTEGCEVKKGEAFVVTPADCLTIVAKSNKTGKVFAMHAGRESIFDVNKMDRPTIIENLLKAFEEDGTKPEDVILWTGFGVSAGSHFDHPEDLLTGEDEESMSQNEVRKLNAKRREYLQENFGPETYENGYLNLHKVVSLMGHKFGIKPENIVVEDAMCTLLKTDEDGNFQFYSNRRDRNQPRQTGRNLVVVTNS